MHASTPEDFGPPPSDPAALAEAGGEAATLFRNGDRVEEDGRAGRVVFLSPDGAAAVVLFEGGQRPELHPASSLTRRTGRAADPS